MTYTRLYIHGMNILTGTILIRKVLQQDMVHILIHTLLPVELQSLSKEKESLMTCSAYTKLYLIKT